MPPSRRRFVLAAVGLSCLGGAGFFAAGWGAPPERHARQATLTPAQAHLAAREGRILLVDIRRPDEWARTGIGAGAHPLDMRRRDFTRALGALAGGDMAAPIALICARGGRSRYLAARLTGAGFRNIIDVPEGMLGSGAGPGWLARELPVMAWRG